MLLLLLRRMCTSTVPRHTTMMRRRGLVRLSQGRLQRLMMMRRRPHLALVRSDRVRVNGGGGGSSSSGGLMIRGPATRARHVAEGARVLLLVVHVLRSDGCRDGRAVR